MCPRRLIITSEIGRPKLSCFLVLFIHSMATANSQVNKNKEGLPEFNAIYTSSPLISTESTPRNSSLVFRHYLATIHAW